MKRYAFGIQFKVGSNNELMVGRCLKVLHGYHYKQSSNSIGVTFPEYCNKTIGSIIGFVSEDQRSLQELMSHHYFQQMQRLKKFFVHGVIAVPENVPEVRYSKEQKIDKYSEAGRQRRLRRGQRIAAKNGYEYEPRRDSAGSERCIQLFHEVPMTSSNRPSQLFYYRIQQHRADTTNCDGYTSYGLANQENAKGTVPELLFFTNL